MRSSWLVAALVMAAAGPACGGSPSTAPSSAPTVETFAGILAIKGSNFYSFAVGTAGTATINLASLTSGTSVQPAATIVGVGFGVPAGEGCGLTNSVTVAPALAAQLTSAVSVGTYCAEIHDAGKLTGPVNFVIRIVHP